MAGSYIALREEEAKQRATLQSSLESPAEDSYYIPESRESSVNSHAEEGRSETDPFGIEIE